MLTPSRSCMVTALGNKRILRGGLDLEVVIGGGGGAQDDRGGKKGGMIPRSMWGRSEMRYGRGGADTRRRFEDLGRQGRMPISLYEGHWNHDAAPVGGVSPQNAVVEAIKQRNEPGVV